MPCGAVIFGPPQCARVRYDGWRGRVPCGNTKGYARKANTVTVAPPQPKPYLNIDEAVAYLHSLGFASATTESVKYAAYYTDKLPRPKVLSRRSYWARTDLDKFVESL